MARRDYDESDVRIRPSRRTKPRTKDRPSHDNAINAFVITVDRGRTTCVIEDGTVVTAMKARELGPKSVVVGDHVKIVGDTTGVEGSRTGQQPPHLVLQLANFAPGIPHASAKTT